MNVSAIFTVVAQDYKTTPFTIGSYNSQELAEQAVVVYFGTRCIKDVNAVPHCLSCASTWRIFETDVYVVVHELNEVPKA